MALVKQNVPIVFTQGINTKVDDKSLVPGTLTVLENAVFTTINKLSKRFGYSSFGLKKLDDSFISTTKALTSYKTEMNMYADNKFYARSPSLDRWVDKGSVTNMLPKSEPVLRNAYEQSAITSICVNNINLYAWEDSRGGVRASTTDASNDTIYLSDFELDASAHTPKVVQLFNALYVFYVDGTDLKYRRLVISDPTTFEAEVSVLSDFDVTDQIYDVMSLGDRIFIGYHATTASNKLALFNIDQDGTASSVVTFNETPDTSIRLISDDNNRVVLLFTDGSDVKVTIYPFSLSGAVLGITTIESTSSVVHVTGIHDTGDNYEAYYEISAASSSDHFVRKNTFDVSGTVGTPTTLIRGSALASHAFKLDDTIYLGLVHDSPLQDTYFISDSSANIVGRISPGISGGIITKGKLGEVTALGDSKFLFANQVKGRSVSEDNDFFSLLGVNSTILDFEPDVNFQDENLGDNLHISGGIMQMYDGASIVEHGFHLFPEGLSAGTNSASGGSMSDGTFLYFAVYAWTDNQGQLHRSAPSVGLSVTTSAGGSSQTQDIVVPTLRHTAKENVVIELYRTIDGGTVAQLVTTVASPEFNDKTVDSITITDTLDDTTLESRELLYTTGGVLPNDPALASQLVASYGTRLFIAGLEDQNLIAFSKIRGEGEPVAFSDFLTIAVNPKGGAVTQIKVLDDKLIIFKKNNIFALAGEGPTNIGTLDDFNDPQEISSDVGCSEPESVVATPQGLMFKSTKGIYLLTRGLQTIYIGDRVEKFNGEKVTSGVLVPDTNQVRFTTAESDTLVFDYLMNQWSTFTNLEANDAASINNVYTVLSKFGAPKAETKSYNDDGVPIKLRLETGWLSFAGIQAFQRVYKYELLGDFKSPHLLRCRTAYNFTNAFIHEKIIDTSTFIDNTRYGEDSPYGSPSTKAYGGNGNEYQMQVKLKKQKCESIKIQIEEIQTNTADEGLSLSAMTLQVGAKTGLFKTDQNRDFGTE